MIVEILRTTLHTYTRSIYFLGFFLWEELFKTNEAQIDQNLRTILEKSGLSYGTGIAVESV